MTLPGQLISQAQWAQLAGPSGQPDDQGSSAPAPASALPAPSKGAMAGQVISQAQWDALPTMGGKDEPQAPSGGLLSRVGQQLSQVAQHPIDAIVGGIKGAAQNFNDAVLRPVQDQNGQLGSWLQDPTGRFGQAVLGEQPISAADAQKAAGATAGNIGGALLTAATGGLGGAIAGGALAGAANNPEDPGVGAITGGILGGAGHGVSKGVGAVAGNVADRARASLVDQTIKTERNAAYQGVRAGKPITDPDLLDAANHLANRPEGQDAFKVGQRKVFNNTGRVVPDLPQTEAGAAPTSLAYAMKPSEVPKITSLTPDQFDAWKQGAHALDMDGAFAPLLDMVDQKGLIPGYQAARGLHEASTRPAPGLAEIVKPTAKGVAAAGALAHGNVMPAVGLAGWMLNDLRNAPTGRPLSANAVAALRGAQQQAGALPILEILRRAGAVPAAATAMDRTAPLLPTAAVLAAIASQNGGATQ